MPVIQICHTRVLNIAVFGRLTLIVIDVNVLLWSIAVMRFGTAYKRNIVGTTGINKTVYCLNDLGGGDMQHGLAIQYNTTQVY